MVSSARRVSVLRLYDNFIYAVAESEGVYGVWMSWGASQLPTWPAIVYTDRPIYRPGETVYFRGVIRDRQDMTYTRAARRNRPRDG